MDQYKKKLQLRLVDETTKAKLSVKDSIEYVVKYFHRLGQTDYKMSQSTYEKLRSETKQISTNDDGTIQILQQAQSLDKLSDIQKIDELIEIHLQNITKHALRPDRPNNFMKTLVDPNGDTEPEYDKEWNMIFRSTDKFVTLMRLKHKI